MRKLNGLGRRLLSRVNPISGQGENDQKPNSHRDQTERLSQPIEETFDHGCSWNEIKRLTISSMVGAKLNA
jgi:hypothetical protein